MQISRHLTLEQATRSQTASRLKIKNDANPKEIEQITITAKTLFDPCKDQFPDLQLTSLFRNAALNTAIKGSKTSQHCLGQACDIDRPTNALNKELFEWCRANLTVGQLIWEFGTKEGPDWVHIGLGAKKQILRAYAGKDGSTKYTVFDY